MKKIIYLGLSIALSAGILSSCHKKDDSVTPSSSVDTQQSVSSNSNDVTNASTKMNQALDDVNSYVSSSPNGREDFSFPCGVKSIDTTSRLGWKTYKFVYDGSSHCNGSNFSRSGTIIVTLIKGPKFSSEGAVWTVSFSGFRTNNNNDSNTVQFDGLHTVTNTSGGSAKWVTVGNKVTHIVRSNNMMLTFADGTTRTWSVVRGLSYANTAGVYSITESGDTTIGGTPNVVIWGTTRKGYTFVTSLAAPMIYISGCSWFPTSGERTHVITDPANGKFISIDELIIPGTLCADGYKITYKKLNGNVVTYSATW